MAFCNGCGAQVPDGTAFCQKCGKPIAASPGTVPVADPVVPVTPQNPGAPATTGLQENVAGTLCYVLGWVTGLIFFLIDKRPSVRFHAAQSIVVFGGLHILSFILGIVLGRLLFMGGMFGGFGLFWLLTDLIWLVAVVLWVLLMVKAYQGERFRVPIAANFADQLAGKQV
jgi:uncharacterized membrane protein